jgi:hypothetical protein
MNKYNLLIGEYVSIDYSCEYGIGVLSGTITKITNNGISGISDVNRRGEWFVLYSEIDSISIYHTDFDLGI